jgi:alpha-tubulin suppressor-like RCC1 family protein
LNISNITQISSGCIHSLLLSQSGNVFSFGDNYVKIKIYLEFRIRFILILFLGLGDNQKRYIPTIIPILDNIKFISAGSGNSMAINQKNKYISFGTNTVFI